MKIDLEALVEARYAAPKWVTFRQLRNGPGFAKGSIDLASFAGWESGKGVTIAFEVKRYKADFIRELANPAKRAWVEENFMSCYFVTPFGMLEKEEVPRGWGLLEAQKNGKRLRAKLIAPQNPAIKLNSRVATMVVRKSAEAIARAQTLVGEGHGPGKCVSVDAYEQERLDRISCEQELRNVSKPLRELQALAGGGKGQSVRGMVDTAAQRLLGFRLRALSRARDAINEVLGDEQ